ncbi:small multi-drug export protein [Oceanobacillus sp. J11TS1]|uniref:small multi-drug export protein n=1 Tax=Oceanobacillus sp. J11TS1 TaxID=2807191 RepID=UPI001B29A8AB|nr:small multi-drug export protein [Oceanobacillus sp. J11TS1]GIO25287.1 multidrug SMR transporter [Oceanobacillus sp. J11TS1]
MLEYISLALTAWFIGFFPFFEIYIAIPAAMVLGLDPVSSVLWAVLGNFLPIPLIAFFYDFLAKFERINRYLSKLANSKYKAKIEKHGPIFVIFLTPLIGSWAVGVIGYAIGMKKFQLFISSAISILIYGIIIAILTHLGIDFLN